MLKRIGWLCWKSSISTFYTLGTSFVSVRAAHQRVWERQGAEWANPKPSHCTASCCMHRQSRGFHSMQRSPLIPETAESQRNRNQIKSQMKEKEPEKTGTQRDKISNERKSSFQILHDDSMRPVSTRIPREFLRPKHWLRNGFRSRCALCSFASETSPKRVRNGSGSRFRAASRLRKRL